MSNNSRKARARAAATRPIRFDQFKRQLDEVGVKNLQEIQMSETDSIWIRLGNSIDAEDADEFNQRLDDAADAEEVAMVLLDYYPEATADEQWKIYTKHGGTADQLSIIFANATSEQAERLGKLRLKRS